MSQKYFKKIVDIAYGRGILWVTGRSWPVERKLSGIVYMRGVFTMASVNMHNINLKEFNEVLASCKGDVFMVTPEGDRLNLKSKLCQLIGFTKLIEGGNIAQAKLECSNSEDESKLFRFNMFGEK